MGYRVTAVPEGSAAASAGLRVADVLAEPQILPDRLASAGPQGVDIPIFRFDRGTGRYARTMTKVTFAAGDFIPKIDETFVHSVDDLKLVDAAYQSGAQVEIHFTRWFPESNDFKKAVSRRRFVR